MGGRGAGQALCSRLSTFRVSFCGPLPKRLRIALYVWCDTLQSMAKRPIALRLDEALIGRVDVARGDVSRTRWVERALEAALDDERGPSSITPEVWESKALTSQMYPDASSKPRAAPSLPAGVSKGTADVKAPYRCPSQGCSLRTLSPAATCPRHAKKVVPNV